MTVIGEARYTNKTLVLSTPLNLEEGMRVIVLEIEGAYVLIPVSQDEGYQRQIISLVEAAIRDHRETLEALAR
jgi:hypothetical protein